MHEFMKAREEKRGINKILLGGVALGLVVIGLIVWVLSMQPSEQEQLDRILADAHKEGSPQYAEISRDIIIETDEKTVQSPTALGGISMFIHGNIKNLGTKTIDILEINVAVVTQFNDVLKQKRVIVVPVQRSVISPGESIPVTLTLDGFKKEDDRANIRWKVTAIREKQ